MQKPDQRYQNSKAAKLEYVDNILIAKECKACGKMKPVLAYRKVAGEKLSKTGLATYCQECERARKKAKRKEAGMKDQWIPATRQNNDGDLLEKECRSCGLLLPIDQFHAQKLGRWGKRSSCRKCNASKTYMAKYGIDTETKERAYKEQSGRCQICKKQKEFDELYIDHDHTAKRENCFRGLLCNDCNWAYGALGDGNDDTVNNIKGVLFYYSRTKNIPYNHVLELLRDVS